MAGPGHANQSGFRGEPVRVLDPGPRRETEHSGLSNVTDPRALANILQNAEAALNEVRHPDPVIGEYRLPDA